MKDDRKKKPEIKVVEEDADAVVVRLGDDEPPVVLGGVPKRDQADAEPQHLELENAPAYDVRSEEPSVEKILESEDLDAPDVTMEREWGGEGKRWVVIPWGWFALIALLCGGLAVWSLQRIRENQPEAIRQAQAKVEESELAERLRQAEARKLYKSLEARVAAYLAADTIPELLKHVRDPGRVEPLMKKWYADHALKPADFQKFWTFQPVTLERRPFWIINAETGVGTRSLLVEQTSDDDGLIDWETDVCYQPMDWDQFVNERPAGEFDFRVRARPDYHYSHEFADDSRYRCLRLMTRGSDEHLFGYVLRGSDEERQIAQVTGSSRGPVAVILRISFLQDSPARHSVVIHKVIGRRWCLVGKDDAGKPSPEPTPEPPPEPTPEPSGE
jgi:hypothetical protein